MTETGSAPAPRTMRLLTSPDARELTRLMATFDDLQTVLRCCELLVTELARGDEADPLVVEAVWTLALLSYGRCFATSAGEAVLSEDDVVAAHDQTQVLDWHRLLLRLRDHHANPDTNPREKFSVGAAQDDQGAVSGIALTSTHQPMVDDLTVRQAGAIAFALSEAVDRRIAERQRALLEQLSEVSVADLETLVRVELVVPT